MQELNKKLAEWAGFVGILDYPNKTSIGHPSQQSGLFVNLNFTESLDACFKWLVPKVFDDIVLLQHTFFKDHWWAKIGSEYEPKKQIVVEAKGAALAICLAIEKLIDREEVHAKSNQESTTQESLQGTD